MKKCPFCAEDIQDDAIKCRYCGEYLNESQHTTDDPPIKKQLIEENRGKLDTFPNKPYSMNQVQKRILIGVIVILMAMIAYPPFHVIYNNGFVLNMGYGWIFDPPEVSSVKATVNVFMLLIQWFGVLVIGGIAFFLTKGASLTSVSSSQQTTAVTPPTETPKDKVEGLYEAMLGEKNRDYYLAKFKKFDQQGPGPSWNWAVFFGGGIWVLYRKMYGWFFVFWGVAFISGLFYGFLEEAGFSALGFLLLLGAWIAFTMFANSLYYGSVKKKIAVAQLSIRDRSRLLEFLSLKGGVHTWVIWVFGLIPVIGILAAIVIPHHANYSQRVRAAAETAAVQKLAERQLSQEDNSKTDFNKEIDSVYANPAPATKKKTVAIAKPPKPEVPAIQPQPYDEAADMYEMHRSMDIVMAKRPKKEIARDGRFIAYNNGTVLDTQTNLMWAARDNGKDITWKNAGNVNRKLTICDNRILTTPERCLKFEMTRVNHLTSSLSGRA